MADYGVWYTFVGDGQNTTISTNPAFDIKLSIATGSCGSLSNIVCTDVSPETATFLTTLGTTYYVYVAYWSSGGSTTGTFTISRTCVAAPVPPPNDLCANATTLNCGDVLVGETTVNTTNVAHGTACSMSDYGVWYTFVGDGQSTTITVSNESYDVELSISSGSCGSFAPIGCLDDPETYTFTTVNGVTYYVYVAYYSTSSTTGTFDISRTCTAPPADPCSSVISIADCGVVNSQTYTGGGAGQWSSSYCGFGTPGIEQVYSFVAPTTGTYSIEVTAASGYVDYGWQATSCAETGWTCIGDLISTGTYGSLLMTAGTTYYFLLDDENSITGTHTFYIGCPPCGVSTGTVSASPNTFCPAVSGNTTLSLSGEDPAATIQWQISTDGGATWADIPGATTDPWVQAVSTTSMFQALVTNGCTSTSQPFTVNFGCSIIQPTSGFASTVIGCGSSYNYYDSGGSGSAYTINENGLITILPDIAGQYVSVSVNSFNIESTFDYLYVFDGDNASATIIGIYTGTLGVGTTFTASSANISGALSFRFTSDSFTNNAGWDLTCSCTGTAAAPYVNNIEDCTGGTVICSDSPLIGGTTGYGLNEIPDGWNACLDVPGEDQSQWYIFSAASDGTIGFEITPNAPTDYDWAIWGPYTSLQCPAFTNDFPIRCNATQLLGNGNTGLVAGSTDIIEENGTWPGEVTDADCRPLTVSAGEVYVMLLDNWEGSSIGFQLDWNLTDGASLDCDPPLLPVSLSSFSAKCDNGKTILNWTTQSEVNNNFFVLEKSKDGRNFREIGKVFGNGTINTVSNYEFKDYEKNEHTVYYRLLQVDYDGSVTYHNIISSVCEDIFDEDDLIIINNPDNFELVITNSKSAEINVYMIDYSGRLVYSENERLSESDNRIIIPKKGLSAGLYNIVLQTSNNIITKQIVIPR